MHAALAKPVGVILSMPSNIADCKVQSKRDVCSLPKDVTCWTWQNARMADDKNGGPNLLKAWREYRGLTQEELASKVSPPTTGSVISLLEDGERGLSLKWLRRLAPALGTRAGFLADVDPREADSLTLELVQAVPDGVRDQVNQILRTFLKDGTSR